MKTVVKNGSYKRVNDLVAEKLVREELWNYTSKSSWKKNVRDVKRTKAVEVDAEVKEQVLTEKQKKIQKLKAQQR
jgi:hypothetical protein